ncbi:hypothetical protein [Rhodobacter capsulatus]|jgi:hypothetical protein|uniref:Uncharacterized protein n=1 Tax=Rhodobacter capsulatus (strain ATCC BAA-309 / NBRC 16581 / SB1003) TaxID=272942 RepID=D5APV1_RHOCB|nr:hypothetical protein [Rhodobacter capsulatus]ADE86670.1 conserved hypothetical protein [Rhodobacter capsulatus SB 1003]ETD00249.1 hypothetical protein U714_16135 [Rhodobacter capsulatus DE442]ETD74589.1 hypothetical protein U717_16100 [Rhodobacter capsulatus R121]ETE52453.1 hypothetical protein U715_16090 [Rhodobacter capsulatus Y262]MDS0928471.1 hypothetical protein [Rhodobacter capsulatus]
MTPAEIKSVAARRAFATGLSPAEREAEAARIEAELTAEAKAAEQAKAAAAIAAEAQAERQRIAGVIKTGADAGKAMQAARLAISTPLDATGARAVLATLPPDASATAEALAIPEAIGTFGTQAAVNERRRVASILGHPEAADRFATASALALETDLTLAQAVSALLAAPKAEARKYPTFEQRQREAGSFGPSFDNGGGMSKGERIDSMWAKAVKDANASIGAAGLAGGAMADLTRG